MYQMKRQSANSSGAVGGEKRNRHSSRTTVLSKAFRVVDAETRQEVRNKRIVMLMWMDNPLWLDKMMKHINESTNTYRLL
jgi:hypothetical protein